jgi:hypothetical protein
MRDTTIIRNSISKLESDIEITMKRLHRAKLSQVKNKILIFLKFFFFCLYRMKLKIKLIDQLLMKKKMMVEIIYSKLTVHKHLLKKFFMITE